MARAHLLHQTLLLTAEPISRSIVRESLRETLLWLGRPFQVVRCKYGDRRVQANGLEPIDQLQLFWDGTAEMATLELEEAGWITLYAHNRDRTPWHWMSACVSYQKLVSHPQSEAPVHLCRRLASATSAFLVHGGLMVSAARGGWHRGMPEYLDFGGHAIKTCPLHLFPVISPSWLIGIGPEYRGLIGEERLAAIEPHDRFDDVEGRTWLRLVPRAEDWFGPAGVAAESRLRAALGDLDIVRDAGPHHPLRKYPRPAIDSSRLPAWPSTTVVDED